MSRIQQDWLLPLIESDDDFRERFYDDNNSLEADYNPLPVTHTVMVILVTTNHPFWRKTMKKIYCFDCNNTDTTVTIDQFQTDPNQVVMKVHHGENILVLQFDKDEFHDLCAMRFNIDYPVLPAKPDLSLVA